MTSVPQRWAQHARYDFDTAREMLASGRLLYVLVCCQQALEKMLKALIAKRTNEAPPRLHNLMRLAERAGLQVGEARADFLRELSAFYVQSRYPEEMEDSAAQPSLELARETLGRTEEVL